MRFDCWRIRRRRPPGRYDSLPGIEELGLRFFNMYLTAKSQVHTYLLWINPTFFADPLDVKALEKIVGLTKVNI